ncbi:MAG: type II secretion system F family protein [Chloroflexota bacterium]
MASFSYKAYLSDNKTEAGKIEALDEREALRLLSKQSKRVFFIEEATKHSEQGIVLKFQKKPDLLRVFEDLSELISAGLNVDVALKLMTESEPNRVHRDFYNGLMTRITEGKSLSSALSQYEFIPSNIIALVQAGEHSGRLDEVIGIISEDISKSRERRRSITEILVYPIFLLFVMVVAIVAITEFLIPAIEPLFAASDNDIPFVFSIFKVIQSVIGSVWFLSTALVVLLTSLYLAISPQQKHTLLIHQILTHTPILGTLVSDANFSKYFQVLSLLLRNKVSLQEALKIAAQSCPNTYLKGKLTEAANEVTAGRTVPDVLSETGLFKADIISIVRVGDQVNKLSSVMSRAANLMDSRNHRKIKTFTALITPAITIIMGLLVGLIAYSVMEALLSINELAV